MAKKSRKGRRRRRGMGSIIAVRSRGMGNIKQLRATRPMSAAIPVLVGGGLTALTVVGIRYFVASQDAPSENQLMLYKWAGAAGLAVGAVGAAALSVMGGGAGAATIAALSSGFVAAAGYAHDWLAVQYPITNMAALLPPATATGEEPATTTQQGIVLERLRGIGAVVPEQLGAYTETRRGGATQGGSEVSLSGVNTGAFGTPGFRI